MFRKVLSIILILLIIQMFVVATVGAQAKEPEIIIKAEHDMSSQSLAQEVLEFMAKRVYEKTDGRAKLNIYPSLQLSGGNIPNMIRQTQIGATDLSLIPSSVYTPVQSQHGLWSLPFIFKDLEAEYALANSSIGDKLCKITEETNLKTIAIWVRGFRQVLNNVRPIKEPKDLKGLSFRVPENPIYSETFKVLEAQPVTIAWGEVHSALMLKAVDGMETPTMHIVNEKFYELLKYVTFWNYSTDVLLVSINLDLWKKLPLDIQQALIEAAKEASGLKFAKEIQATEGTIKYIESQGMEVTLLTDEQHKAFVEAIKPKVWQMFSDQIGENLIKEAEGILAQ